ncbi:MAG: VTT domain-containing protein [Candidatus Bathyarchaeia archaeon]
MIGQFWEWLYQFALQYGYAGVFAISIIGAISIIIPIPYTLFIYLLGAILEPIPLALAGGLGSAVGEFSGYLIGYYGRAVINKERQRKMDYMLKIFNRYGFITIFLFALTPLPDDLLFIPLGIMRYKFLKVFIPAFLGKSLMCLILAYGGRLSIEFIRALFGDGGWLGGILTTFLLIAIIVLMLKIDWEKVFEKYVAKEAEKS